MVSMFDLIPTQPAEHAVRKLQHRQSYMARASYQKHKSRKQTLCDTILRLSPATWLGPMIIKAYDRWEYKRDKKHTQEVFEKSMEKRGTSLLLTEKIADLETQPAPLDCDIRDAKGRVVDPWRLPPMSEIH